MRRFLIAAILSIIALPLFATEANPSKHQRELIARLLEVTRMNSTTKSMMDAIFGQIEKQFLDGAAAKGNQPEDIAEAKELFRSFRQRAGEIDFEDLLNESYVRIYAKYFTEQEIADLITFYETPTGQKTITVMPQLMSEGMQAGIQNLSPKIEEVMAKVTEEQEKKHPWRRTMSNLRSVATALEAYAIDHDDECPQGDYAALKALLSPTYLTQFPEKDIWDHPFAYVVSADRHHYRLISGGADSNFEWDSRRIVAPKEGDDVRYSDRLEDDLIYADGQFVQLPLQAKPKAAQ